MATITIEKSELNRLVRENLIDILKNRNDLLEIIEDITLGKLMDEGKTGEYFSKEEIFKILDNKK